MPDVKHFDPDAVLDRVVRLLWRQGVAGTGIADIVAATGINRSSLYATFGGKKQLYLAALRRYVERQSEPVFDRLAGDERGLPAIAEFFTTLIRARCHGEYARWGCMVTNAHTGAENTDPDVRRILDHHHERLRAAMRTALRTARAQAHLRPGIDVDAAADLLALLAYGVNLRSRAGAVPQVLEMTVHAALANLGAQPPLPEEMS
jgi:TetR/AcrR family transcriptional regulator, transcriptional repressor for nem operon